MSRNWLCRFEKLLFWPNFWKKLSSPWFRKIFISDEKRHFWPSELGLNHLWHINLATMAFYHICVRRNFSNGCNFGCQIHYHVILVCRFLFLDVRGRVHFTVISGFFKVSNRFFDSNNIYGFYCSGKSKTGIFLSRLIVVFDTIQMGLSLILKDNHVFWSLRSEHFSK